MKTIPDIIHNKDTQMGKSRSGYYTSGPQNWYGNSGSFGSNTNPHSSLNEFKPKKVEDTGPDYPVGLKVGDTVYAYSQAMHAWLKGKVTSIVPKDKRVGNQAFGFWVGFRSPEHQNPRVDFYVNRVKSYLTNEMIFNRQEYFRKFPNATKLI